MLFAGRACPAGGAESCLCLCLYASTQDPAARTLSHITAALPNPSCESLILLHSVAVFCTIEASWTGSSVRITDVSRSQGDTNYQSLTIHLSTCLCLKAPTRLSTPQLHIFPAAWASIPRRITRRRLASTYQRSASLSAHHSGKTIFQGPSPPRPSLMSCPIVGVLVPSNERA